MTPFEVMAFALLGLLVVMVVAAAIALLWVAGQEKRTIDRLALTPCPVCRQPLGKAAVNAGRLRAHEAMEDVTDESDTETAAPEHLPATWLIECPHCHSGMQFDVERRAWLKVQHPHQAE